MLFLMQLGVYSIGLISVGAMNRTRSEFALFFGALFIIGVDLRHGRRLNRFTNNYVNFSRAHLDLFICA